MNELIALALRRAGVNTLAEFQALQGLPQTGEADPETQLALEPVSTGFPHHPDSARRYLLGAGCPLWHHLPSHCHCQPLPGPGAAACGRPHAGAPGLPRGSNRCAHDLEPVQPVYPRPGGPVSRALPDGSPHDHCLWAACGGAHHGLRAAARPVHSRPPCQ